MEISWDDVMKMLVRENQQALVSFLLPGARFLGEQDKELKVRTIHADWVSRVEWLGQEMVLHAEFQRRRDTTMARRVWEYNAACDLITNLPVASFVLYLVDNGSVVEPPYSRLLPYGQESQGCAFTNVKLWELPGELLKQPGLEGLLPLLPLLKEGKRREVVEEMIGGLKRSGKEALLPLGYVFAAFLFQDDEEQRWLKERFWQMTDVLEGSWAYQELVEKGMAKGLEQGLQKGLEQGLQKGLEQGLQQGELQALRSMLNRFVETHFPPLVSLARQQTEQIHNPESLQALVDALFTAQSIEDAQQALFSNDNPSETSL